MSVRIFDSSSYTARPSEDVLILCDNKDLLSSKYEVALNCVGIDASNNSLAGRIIEKLSPSSDNGAAANMAVMSGDSIRNCTFGLLPTACSRMNSPARPHAIATLVGSNKANTVVLIPSSNDHVFAQVSAVSRQFHTFALTKSKKSAHTKIEAPADETDIDIVVVFPTNDSGNDSLLKQLSVICDDIRLCAHLVEMPPNLLNCKTYVEEARKVHARIVSSLSSSKIPATATIEVIQGRELEERGFGGLWGVGKASDNLPALVILSYLPTNPTSEKSICMVGKGIVYDTGGLSIKVPPNMAGMKCDMGGSAGVLGGFDALARSDTCTVPVHALLCIAENAVSNEATRPDDIHIMYSGKTVEVNNTDAEGRLVLSDGVAYAAKHLNPSHIMNMATLTGAQLISTGKRFGAIYCNDDGFESVAVSAGKFSGDLVHPLPYCPEFFRAEFKSTVADMKNSVADRGNAQSACAGQFIGNHIEDYLKSGGKWLHIDMAGPVWIQAGRASGYGVALLYSIVQSLQK